MPDVLKVLSHDGAIVSSFLRGDYHAECSCEWKGPDRNSSESAETDLYGHYSEVSELPASVILPGQGAGGSLTSSGVSGAHVPLEARTAVKDEPSASQARVPLTPAESALAVAAEALVKISGTYPWIEFDPFEVICEPHESIAQAYVDTETPTNRRAAREALEEIERILGVKP